MKNILFLALSFWAAFLVVSCNKDDISFDEASQELSFSRDTVFCDTVYNQIRSETYAVKVYNNEDKDVLIPSIILEKGATSMYKINVDGKAGYNFTNVPLRKKDSLYIFVEIAPVATSPEAIAEDRVLFTTASGTQHVTLFSVVQDAEFFIETPTNPNVISGNVNWNNNKAKIIFGDLNVEGTLNIQPGTKVYFHKNSGMKVKSAGKLNINGTLGSEVVLRGERSDPKYDTIPNNWNSIKMEQGSLLNMNYARLFGGVRGLELYNNSNTSTPSNLINSSLIYNFQEYGIYAVNASVAATNLVMNNCGDAAFGVYKGGSYSLIHSTLANYSDLLASKNRLSLFVSNEWKNASGQTEYGDLTLLNLYNSIFYSDRDNAVNLERTPTNAFNWDIKNCLIKYSNPTEAGFQFDNMPNIVASIKNQEPKFMNYFATLQNLRVKADSPAKNAASTSIANQVPLDIVGVSRTSTPTIGAYQ